MRQLLRNRRERELAYQSELERLLPLISPVAARCISYSNHSDQAYQGFWESISEPAATTKSAQFPGLALVPCTLS